METMMQTMMASMQQMNATMVAAATKASDAAQNATQAAESARLGVQTPDQQAALLPTSAEEKEEKSANEGKLAELESRNAELATEIERFSKEHAARNQE